MRNDHAAFLATLTRFENRLRPQIVRDKREFILSCRERYESEKAPNFFDLVDWHQHTVFQTLKHHYAKVIPAFGSLTLSQVKSRQFKDAQEDHLFSRLAQQWISTEGLKRSQAIADTSEADVLKAISEGFEEGEGVAEIGRRIRRVTQLSPFRADLIARTETHAAANYAGIESVREAEKELGVTMLKEWLPTLDERTRESHAAMQGSDPIPMNEKFDVGGEMLDRPGDPAGSIATNANCRCTLIYSEAE